jgi:hypothetical protein
MKTLKLAMAGMLALSIGGLASAQTVVNVSGSTAFRSLVTAEEATLLNNAGPNLETGYPAAAYNGSSYNGASYSIVHGYLSDGVTEVYFRNHWTGSAGGVVDLTTGNTTLAQIPTTATMSQLTVGVTSDSNGTSGAPTTDAAAPNIAMSDALAADIATEISTEGAQGVTDAGLITGSAVTDGGSAAGADGGPVATVNFTALVGAVASGQSVPASLLTTGLTQETLRTLVQQGSLPLQFITGNTSDAGNFLIWVGRNEDSGTRIAYMGESGDTVKGGIKQFMAKQSGIAYPANYTYSSLSADSSGLTGFQLWPSSWQLNTVTSLNWRTQGHSGYNGGGDVAAILGSPDPVAASGFTDGISNAPSGSSGSSNYYFVTVIGTHDAQAAIGNGAQILPYNGVILPYSGGSGGTYTWTALQNGQYSLWNQEHLYYLTSGTGTQAPVSGTSKTIADDLADAIYNTTTANLGQVGCQITSVNVSRSTTVGSPIVPGHLQ